MAQTVAPTTGGTVSDITTIVIATTERLCRAALINVENVVSSW